MSGNLNDYLFAFNVSAVNTIKNHNSSYVLSLYFSLKQAIHRFDCVFGAFYKQNCYFCTLSRVMRVKLFLVK